MRNWCAAALLVAAVALGLGPSPAQEKGPKPNIPADRIKKIEDALPAKAPAKPARPRKVLVFTLATGYVHGSIPTGAEAFAMMGRKTGAFETVTSSDPAMFEEDKLKDFDAVLLLSTTGEGFGLGKGDFAKLPPEKQAYYERLRKNLLDFVGRGKGLMGIHAASDAGYDWPEYGKLIGGYFASHPYGKITMKIDDPASPINACFKGQEYTIEDEIYVFRDVPYSRDRLHVLLSIDTAKSGIKSGPRKDNDYAVSWIQKVGSGRVFYCSLGHRDETYWNPTILAHYLAGLQYALGDLPADATPSNKLSSAGAK
jgi:type 1 glutamine amidotransferase